MKARFGCNKSLSLNSSLLLLLFDHDGYVQNLGAAPRPILLTLNQNLDLLGFLVGLGIRGQWKLY